MSATAAHEIWLEALQASYEPSSRLLFATAPRVKGNVTNDGKQWEVPVTCWTLGLGFVFGPPDDFSSNNRTMYFALKRVEKYFDGRMKTKQLHTEVIQLGCAATIVVRNMRIAGCTFTHSKLIHAVKPSAGEVLKLGPVVNPASELLANAWGTRTNAFGHLNTRPLYADALMKELGAELKHLNEVRSFARHLLDHQGQRIIELCLLRMMDACVEFENLPRIKPQLMFWSGDMKTGAQPDVHKAFPVENEIQTMWSSFAEALSLISTEPQSDEKQAASSSSSTAAVADVTAAVASMQVDASDVQTAQISRVRKHNDATTDGRGSYKRPRTDATLQAAHRARPAAVLEELELLQTARHVERALFGMIFDYADDFSLAVPLQDAKVRFDRFTLSGYETQAFASNRQGRLAAVFFERGDPRTIKVYEKDDYKRPRYICDISRMHTGVAQPPKVKPVRNDDESSSDSSSESESDYDDEYDPRVSRIRALHVTESGLVLFLACSYDTMFRFGLWDIEAQKVLMLMESTDGTHIDFAHKPYLLSSMINRSAPSLTAVAIEVPFRHEIHVFTYDNLRHALVKNSKVVLPNLHQGAEQKALQRNTYVEYFMSNGGDVFRRIDNMLFMDAAGTQTVSQLSLASFVQPGEPLLCCFANGPSDEYVLMSLQKNPRSRDSRTQLWILQNDGDRGAFRLANRIDVPRMSEPLVSISLVPNERVIFAFGWQLYEMKLEQPLSEAEDAASSSSAAAAATATAGVASMQLDAAAASTVNQEAHNALPETVLEELKRLASTRHIQLSVYGLMHDYVDGFTLTGSLADTTVTLEPFESPWIRSGDAFACNKSGRVAIYDRYGCGYAFRHGYIGIYENGNYLTQTHLCHVAGLHENKVKLERKPNKKPHRVRNYDDEMYDGSMINRIVNLHVTESGLVLFVGRANNGWYFIGLWDVEVGKITMLQKTSHGMRYPDNLDKPILLSSMVKREFPHLTTIVIEAPAHHTLHVFVYDTHQHKVVKEGRSKLDNLHDGKDVEEDVEYFCANSGDTFRRVGRMLYIDGHDGGPTTALSLAEFAQAHETLTCCFANGSKGNYVVMSLEANTRTNAQRTEIWVLQPGNDGTFAVVNRIQLPQFRGYKPLRSISVVPAERLVCLVDEHLLEVKFNYAESAAAAAASSSATVEEIQTNEQYDAEPLDAASSSSAAAAATVATPMAVETQTVAVVDAASSSAAAAAAAGADEKQHLPANLVQNDLLELYNTKNVEKGLFSIVLDYTDGCFFGIPGNGNTLVFEESKTHWHKHVTLVGANTAGQMALVVHPTTGHNYHVVLATPDTLDTENFMDMKFVAMPGGKATAVHMSASGIAIVAHLNTHDTAPDVYFVHPNHTHPSRVCSGIMLENDGEILDISSIYSSEWNHLYVAVHCRGDPHMETFLYDTVHRHKINTHPDILENWGNPFGPAFVSETDTYARAGNGPLRYRAQFIGDSKFDNPLVEVNTFRCEPNKDIAYLTNGVGDTFMYMVGYNKAIETKNDYDRRGEYSLFVVSRTTGRVVHRMHSNPLTEVFSTLSYAGGKNLYCAKKSGGLVRVKLEHGGPAQAASAAEMQRN